MLRFLVCLVVPMVVGAGLGAQTFEAESGERAGTVLSTELAGYSGTGYVTGFDEEGDRLTIPLDVEGGLYDLYIRYAGPFGDKFNALYVNGEQVGSVSFPASESFEETHAGKIFLEPGGNTVALVKDWGWIHVDAIRLASAQAAPIRPVATGLVSPDVLSKADSLYQLLARTYGSVILAGQYGGEAEFARIQAASGKSPVVRGFDFMDYSPSRVERGTTSDETDQALDWAAQRGVVTFSWHWNAPKNLIDTPGKEWWRGFYTDATTFDIRLAMDESGEEYDLLLRDIDAIAVQLRQLADAEVPVLWRPLHEAEGRWFWWGAHGPEPCKWLWRLLFDRLTVHHGLDNLIWVWTSTGNDEATDWYPGDAYVDIVGADIYPQPGDYGSQFLTFDRIADLYGGKKIIALTENGSIPHPEKLLTQRAGWSWFCTWSGAFITDDEQNGAEHIAEVFNHDYVITLDEIDRIDDIVRSVEKKRRLENSPFDDTLVKDVSIPDHYTEVEKPGGPPTTVVNIDVNDPLQSVSPWVFGNNANVYMTQMVDQPALLAQLSALSPNVIRFPGGNLSSVYFWNADPGQPPADAPEKIVDAAGNDIDPGYWYGNNTQSWTLSVDNYYQMLEETDSEGIITVNYGYARYGAGADPVAAAAHLAAEWVRRDNGQTMFWEIGNESNGAWQAGYRINTAQNQDGQPEIVSGALYGKHFLVFADSMRKAAAEIGHTIYIGAQLLAEPAATWWNDTDRNWNEGVFEEAGDAPDFYIIHSYYTPYQTDSSPEEILASGTQVTRDMIAYVHASATSAGVTPKPVALTEWNIFAEGSRQMVSFISGMHAAIVVGELIANGYGLACRWDLANGWSDGNDHGMFSQGDQPGVPRWHARPAFFFLYYLQRYFGTHLVHSSVEGSDDVLAYASTYPSGEVAAMLVNTGLTAETVLLNLEGHKYGDRYYYHALTGGDDNGEFSLRVFVNGEGPTGYPAGGPADPVNVPPRASPVGGGVTLDLPPRSVVYVLVEHGDRVITSAERFESRLEVYPNPAKGTLNVKLPDGRFGDIILIDAQGRRVVEDKIASGQGAMQLPLPASPGLYFIILESEQGRLYQKVQVH